MVERYITSPPFTSTILSPLFPFLPPIPLEVGPFQLGVLGERCNLVSPRGVWGGAQAEIVGLFCAFKL